MSFFDAHLIEILAAVASATLAFAVSFGIAPVVRVVKLVSVVVPRVPSRARRR